MQPIQGSATLTFDDGTSFQAEVDVRFREVRGLRSGSGTIKSPELMQIIMKDGSPVLECHGRKVRVFVTNARGDGTGLLKTAGGPIA